jgi:hypothetical protein
MGDAWETDHTFSNLKAETWMTSVRLAGKDGARCYCDDHDYAIDESDKRGTLSSPSSYGHTYTSLQ